MKLAIVGSSWWQQACSAAGLESVDLEPPVSPPANPYSADLAARREAGGKWRERIEAERPDLILDNGGTGLAFVEGPGGSEDLKLLHEFVGTPLVSHLIDPLVTVFQALPSELVWQCLKSTSWTKAVWDQAQAIELQRFGVPNVVHLPMAAMDRPYCTDPLGEPTVSAAVSFIGGQNTTYFADANAVPAQSLLPGMLAQAARRELGPINFYEIYYNLYGLGDAPTEADDPATLAVKANRYFGHKLFHNATQCIGQRDRFVVFLKKQLGEDFLLIGTGWDRAYGLDCRPPLDSYDDYLQHFREVAVNLNLVNGNSETGLNMRHFEITAAGGFMLCYRQAELGRYFEIGVECDTFGSEPELLDKIRYYQAHPDKRREIACAGQRRTLSEHLYSHRLQTLTDMLEKKGSELLSGVGT